MNGVKNYGRWLIRFAVVAILLLVILFVATWLVAAKIVTPAMQSVGPPPSGLQFESSELTGADGSTVACWYSFLPDSKSTIVLLHPLRGNRNSMVDRAKMFLAAGYSVVLVDQQAHGESPGEYITAGYLERFSAMAAVDFAHVSNPNHRVGVVGWSLGGAAALMAEPIAVDAIVLESVYPSIDQAIHDRVAIRFGIFGARWVAPLIVWQASRLLEISSKQLCPIDHIGDVGCPILIAAGGLDQRTRLDETKAMFAAANDPKGLVIFEGAAHEDLFAFDATKYRTEVLGFFARHLGN